MTEDLAPTSTATTRRAMIRDRVEGLIRVPASELHPHPANWRRHPDHQRAALRGVLRQIGYADALLARRDGERLVLIDGHLRQSLDPRQVLPVLVLDVDEAEADLLLATLDPLAALASPDPAALAALLGRVEASSSAVRDLLDDLARGAGLPVARLLADPDHVPEAPEPVTAPGDLWVLGRHRLLCVDATEPANLARLMAGEAADVLWTDPPHGVDYVGKTARALRIAGDAAEGLAHLLPRAFATAGTVLAPGAAVYVCHPAGPLQLEFLQAFVAQGWQLRQSLVWVKDHMVLGHADYHWRHEPIAFGYAPGPGRRGRGGAGWYGGNGEDSVLEVPRPAASREHPTMKPVELIRRCLANSAPGAGIVLDPFAGSGSTLVACEVAGFQGRGMDLDPRYCDVIIRRFEELTGHKAKLAERS
jgi:DNA modification methylase